MSRLLRVRLGVCRKWWSALRCLLPASMPEHDACSASAVIEGTAVGACRQCWLCTRQAPDDVREPAAWSFHQVVLCHTYSEACSTLCVSPRHLGSSALSRTQGQL